MFNALKYTKQLELVGLTREQAETHVQILMDAMDTNFATKADIKELENKILQMEHRILIRVGAMMSVMLTIALTIFGYIMKLH